MLKRRRPDGSPIIQVDQLKDGLVLFEDVADAERYSNYMEADSTSQVNAIALAVVYKIMYLQAVNWFNLYKHAAKLYCASLCM